MDKRNKITQKKYMNTSEKSEVATNKEDLGPSSKMSMCMEEQLMHHLYGEIVFKLKVLRGKDDDGTWQ